MIVLIKFVVMPYDGCKQAEEYVEYALVYVLSSLRMAYNLKVFKSKNELMIWLDMNVPDVDFYDPGIWVEMPIVSSKFVTSPQINVVKMSKLDADKNVYAKVFDACNVDPMQRWRYIPCDIKIYDDKEMDVQ